MDPITQQQLLQWPATPRLTSAPTIESREELADPETLVGKVISLAIGSAATAKRFGVQRDDNSEGQRVLFYVDGIEDETKGGVLGRVLLSPTDAVPALRELNQSWLYPSTKRVWCPMNELYAATEASGLELASAPNAEQYIRQAKDVQKRREAHEKAAAKGDKATSFLDGIMAPAAAAGKVLSGLRLPKRPDRVDPAQETPPEREDQNPKPNAQSRQAAQQTTPPQQPATQPQPAAQAPRAAGAQQGAPAQTPVQPQAPAQPQRPVQPQPASPATPAPQQPAAQPQPAAAARPDPIPQAPRPAAPIPPLTTPASQAPRTAAVRPNLPNLNIPIARPLTPEGPGIGKRVAIYASLVAAAGLGSFALTKSWVWYTNSGRGVPSVTLSGEQWRALNERSSTPPSRDPSSKGSASDSVTKASPGAANARAAAQAKESEDRKQLDSLKSELGSFSEKRAEIEKEIKSIKAALEDHTRRTDEYARKITAQKQQSAPASPPTTTIDTTTQPRGQILTGPGPSTTIPFSRSSRGTP